MDKITIRKEMKEKIKALSEFEINEKSDKIVEHIINSEVFKNAESVMLFCSFGFEPKMDKLIEECYREGKKIFLPTIVFDEIYPVQTTERTKFYIGKFDISEPFGNIYFGDIDLTIMPFTAYDNSLNRVGKGGGFYDKFLSNRDTFKLGVGYKFMQVDEVETNEFDVKLDAVATEEGVVYADN